MESIHVYQISPEELEEKLLKGIKKEIEDLKTNFEPKQPTEWLTRNETRDLLKINLSTLHYWTRDGLLTSYGIGNRVYYKRHEIEEKLTQLS